MTKTLTLRIEDDTYRILDPIIHFDPGFLNLSPGIYSGRSVKAK